MFLLNGFDFTLLLTNQSHSLLLLANQSYRFFPQFFHEIICKPNNVTLKIGKVSRVNKSILERSYWMKIMCQKKLLLLNYDTFNLMSELFRTCLSILLVIITSKGWFYAQNLMILGIFVCLLYFLILLFSSAQNCIQCYQGRTFSRKLAYITKFL